ncbi:MAG TPA: hypothetical protein VGO14_02070 [Solirubrobacteraceae bacterium]|jgi:hypothetical protein|nr:hypothetical protein [Solirubrobacteraceae bacterium]
MKEIRIGPFAQTVALLGLLGFVGFAVYTQLPEIQRYLKVKEM